MTKVYYRPHRGQLADALKETMAFGSLRELKEFVAAAQSASADRYEKAGIEPWILHGKPWRPTAGDVTVSRRAVRDCRCGWYDTRYVCVKYPKYRNCPQCVGMCASAVDPRISGAESPAEASSAVYGEWLATGGGGVFRG